MFKRRKPKEVPNADVIDLLLDSDEATRVILIKQLTLRFEHDELDELLQQVARLERAAGPQSDQTRQRGANQRAARVASRRAAA